MQICVQMIHNRTAGCKRAGHNAPILILTSEMNFSCKINLKSIYNM